MAPPKGVSNNPNGRRKGVQNKTTLEFKQAVTNLLEHATPNMIAWLERVAQEDPGKALTLCGNLAEYAFPKLARTELTGLNGGAIEHKDVTQADQEILNQYLKGQK